MTTNNYSDFIKKFLKRNRNSLIVFFKITTWAKNTIIFNFH